MKRMLGDEAFEELLGRALRPEAVPEGLHERLLAQSRPPRPHWLAVLLSPARIAAGAGVLSLLLGFALGAGNAAVAEESDVAMVTALYAAAEIGDL